MKDQEGYPLFDHDWTESDISETLFTGFMNAVKKMRPLDYYLRYYEGFLKA